MKIEVAALESGTWIVEKGSRNDESRRPLGYRGQPRMKNSWLPSQSPFSFWFNFRVETKQKV